MLKEVEKMFNQSCGCQGMNNQTCGCANNTQQGCGCSMNNWNMMNSTVNGCPRPQPIVAPRRVCVTQQITPVPQPVICPIECRRVNRCMYYPVFYPHYEQTFVNESCQ
jgi:hypothetical protein